MTVTAVHASKYSTPSSLLSPIPQNKPETAEMDSRNEMAFYPYETDILEEMKSVSASTSIHTDAMGGRWWCCQVFSFFSFPHKI